MQKTSLQIAFRASCIALALASISAHAQCTKDTDCKGDRICERGTCTAPKTGIAQTPAQRAPAIGSSPANPAQPDRISTAIQDQLKCEGDPEPGKALRALRSLGYIGLKPKSVIDGMTIFVFEKPVTVFGYKAIEVTGWEDKPDGVFFWRGPGTAPGLQFTVTVEGDAKAVKATLQQGLGGRTSVNKSAPVGGKPTTEITCYGR